MGGERKPAARSVVESGVVRGVSHAAGVARVVAEAGGLLAGATDEGNVANAAATLAGIGSEMREAPAAGVGGGAATQCARLVNGPSRGRGRTARVLVAGGDGNGDAAGAGAAEVAAAQLDSGLREDDVVERESAPAPAAARKRGGGGATGTRRAASGGAKGTAARRKGTRGRRTITRWSQKREDIFVETLAQTANVAASVRASGLSETNVYRKRRQSAEFRARWAQALREGFVQLETQLLERALHGVEKVVWHGGKPVGTAVEFNDRMALALLAAHRGTVTGERAMAADEPVEEVRERVKAKLAEMNRRMGGAG